MLEVRVGTATTLALVALTGFIAWLRSQEDDEETNAVGFRHVKPADDDEAA